MSWSANSRLAGRIRERVANVVLFELQDPRIKLVTVTRVRLARDLSTCEVFYSVLGSQSERSQTAHALADAAGHVRREVAKVLRTRSTPHLRFVYDESVEGGLKMCGLLDQLKKERGDSETSEEQAQPDAPPPDEERAPDGGG